MSEERSARSQVSFPDELEVRLTCELDAPIELVFAVLTQPEYLRQTLAPFGEEIVELHFDVRPGGEYRYVFVPEDGPECAFFGTFLEVEAPYRTVETWHFGGWPGVEAVESIELADREGRTALTHRLVFANAQGRAHMRATDGLVANYDLVAALLARLVESA